MIKLDKSEYLLGEQITAHIQLEEYSKTEKIIVSFEIGEETEVSTTDSDGDRNTSHATSIHEYQEFILEPTVYKTNLRFELPESCIPLFKIDKSNYTFARIHIKYVRKLRPDRHEYLSVPVTIPISIPEGKKVEYDEEKISVKLETNVLYPHQKVLFQWEALENIKFRMIRVALERHVRTQAYGSQELDIFNHKLYSTDQIRGETILDIPLTGIPSYDGKNIEIHYFLKITIDKPFAFDTNVKIPIKYFS